MAIAAPAAFGSPEIIAATEKQSFFCACNSGGSQVARTECSTTNASSAALQSLLLIPVRTSDISGVCTGKRAPIECDRASLEESLKADLYNSITVTKWEFDRLHGTLFTEISQTAPPAAGACNLVLSERSAIAEPPDQLKGDIARRMLYLIARYNLATSDAYYSMLIEWDAYDLVTKEEYLLSRALGEQQKSDNAFVSVRYHRAQKKLAVDRGVSEINDGSSKEKVVETPTTDYL